MGQKTGLGLGIEGKPRRLGSAETRLRLVMQAPILWAVFAVLVPDFVMGILDINTPWIHAMCDASAVAVTVGALLYLLLQIRQERRVSHLLFLGVALLLACQILRTARLLRLMDFLHQARFGNWYHIIQVLDNALNGFGLVAIAAAFFTAIVDLFAAKQKLITERAALREMDETRKRARAELADELNFNRKLIDASTLGILAYKASGECLLANEAMGRIIGTTVEELLKQNFRDIASWREYGLLALAESTLAKEESYSGDLHMITTFGKEVWFKYHMSPFVSTGETHLLLIAEDISEQVRAEKVIAEQRSMIVNTARMSALGVMAGGIAHEVKNPLAIISVGVQQLDALLSSEEPDMDQLQRTREAIIRNVERIDGIIGALRSLSREGSSDPFMQASAKRIVADAVELCRYRFKQHGVALTVSDIGNIEMECRASQLSQVLLNLLNNAYDATEELSERWVRLDVKEDGALVVFSVTDSGGGLSVDDYRKLFVPFYTTKKPGKGVGLGLSISKSIVERHAGTLEIDSECPNTRFVLKIPKRQGLKRAHGDETREPGVENTCADGVS